MKQLIGRPRSFRTSIRQLILFTAAPLVVCVIILMSIFIRTNMMYYDTLTNLSIAGSFNADFQTTVDFKMFQVVIDSEMFEELRPLDDITYAQAIVSRLKETTTCPNSLGPLFEIERYLSFLVRNIDAIVDNQGYDQNMRILDSRIRVLTQMVHQKMQEYIHNETLIMTEIRTDANRNFITTVVIFGGILIVVFAWITVYGFHKTDKLTRPLMALSDNFKTVGEGDFSLHEIKVTSNEIMVLHDAFGTMLAKIEELMEQIAAEKDHLRRTEFQLLQSQINPHFLYNTFDAIIWLTEDGRHDKVKKMMASLSNFCRIALSDGEDIITIKEEIQHVQSYLEIQHIRYFDVLKYEIVAPQELDGYFIPKLSLQPIVENALYHGIKQKRGGGTIQVICQAEQDALTITIRDTGIGISPEKLEQIRSMAKAKNKSGYGLLNVAERFRLYYLDEAKFEITSVVSEYTEVKFTIPSKIPNGNS